MTKKRHIVSNERLIQGLRVGELIEEHQQEIEQTLRSFLEVLDSLDRCFSAIVLTAENEVLAQSWLSNFDGVRQQLVIALEQSGVTFMNCVGQIFDPHRHDAIETRSGQEGDHNIVVKEVARGCEWNGKVLRHAKVIVSIKAL
jgi:molecular chaperone GrpE